MGTRLIILLVVLAAVAGGLWWALSDANRYRGQLEQAAEEATGLDVTIAGDLQWRLWPPVQLTATAIDARWPGAGEPLVRVRRAQLDANLLPLLSTNPRLSVNGILLEGIAARLVVEDGAANWTPPGYTGAPPPPMPVPAATGEDGEPIPFAVDEIRIVDALIHYEDRDAGETTEVAVDELALTNFAPNTDATLSGGLTVTTDVETTVTLDTGVRWDTGADQWLLSETQLDVDYDSLPVNLTAERITADIGNDTLDVTGATLRVADLTADVQLSATELTGDVNYTGTLELPEQHAPELLAYLETELPTPLAAKLQFDGTATAIDAVLELMRVGTTAGNGTVEIALGEPPEVRFDLNLDHLDLDSLAPPAEVAIGAAPAPALALAGAPVMLAAAGEEAESDPDAEIVAADTFTLANWQGTVTADELVFDGQTFHSATLTTENRGGNASAHLVLPKFFDGEATVDATVDATTAEPRWTVKPVLTEVQSQKLMLWLDQRLKWLAPLLLKGEVSFRGTTEREWLTSVEGTAHFDGGEGKIDIAKVKQQMQALAQLGGGSSTIAGWPEILDYERMVGDWQVNGLQHVLSVAIDNLLIGAEGTYDPFADALDMAVTLTFEDDSEYSSLDVNPYLVGIPLPVRCTGSMDALKCRPDEGAARKILASALSGNGNEAVQQKLDEAIEEKVPEEYRDAARALLENFGDLLDEEPTEPDAEEPPPEQ